MQASSSFCEAQKQGRAVAVLGLSLRDKGRDLLVFERDMGRG